MQKIVRKPLLRTLAAAIGVSAVLPASAADPLTRTYALRVSVPNPPAAMRLRMTASVAIPQQGLPDLVHIPASAMVAQQGKAGVWVVQPKSGTASFRPVAFGGVERNDVLVRSGLNTGEVIATAGASYLREGQKVRVMRQAPSAAKPAAVAP